jgi:hypothetical protein
LHDLLPVVSIENTGNNEASNEGYVNSSETAISSMQPSSQIGFDIGMSQSGRVPAGNVGVKANVPGSPVRQGITAKNKTPSPPPKPKTTQTVKKSSSSSSSSLLGKRPERENKNGKNGGKRKKLQTRKHKKVKKTKKMVKKNKNKKQTKKHKYKNKRGTKKRGGKGSLKVKANDAYNRMERGLSQKPVKNVSFRNQVENNRNFENLNRAEKGLPPVTLPIGHKSLKPLPPRKNKNI